MYSDNDFHMYALKVLPCPWPDDRHPWSLCPYFHPQGRDRRRDPLKHLYTSIRCPNFSDGCCEYGDMCGYAHGRFESRLHPATFRTQMCLHGPNCAWVFCFFAHNWEELRPSVGWRQSLAPTSGLPPNMGSSSQPHADLEDQFLSRRFADQAVRRISAIGYQLQQLESFVLPMNTNILSPSNVGHRSLQATFGPSVPTVGNSGDSRVDYQAFWRGRLDDQAFREGRLDDHSWPEVTVPNMEEQFSVPSRLADQAVATHRSAVGSQLQQSQSLESPMNTITFSSTRSFSANWPSRPVAGFDDQTSSSGGSFRFPQTQGRGS